MQSQDQAVVATGPHGEPIFLCLKTLLCSEAMDKQSCEHLTHGDG